MNKIVKELRDTNSAARDLRATMTRMTELLLLDEMLLKAELELGLMDGVPLNLPQTAADF